MSTDSGIDVLCRRSPVAGIASGAGTMGSGMILPPNSRIRSYIQYSHASYLLSAIPTNCSIEQFVMAPHCSPERAGSAEELMQLAAATLLRAYAIAFAIYRF